MVAVPKFATEKTEPSLDPAAEAFLRVPPARPLEIFVAAAGPQTLKIAGELGDGLIVSNLSFPTALVREGALADAMEKLSERRRPFTRVLHLHVSVARDGDAARRFCRRMAANSLIGGHLLRRRHLSPRQMIWFDRLLPAARLLEYFLPAPGMSLIVVGRKPTSVAARKAA